MFEFIVGLALLPMAIVVGVWLLALGVAAIWILGGWLMALAGVVCWLTVLASITMLGIIWGGYSAAWALSKAMTNKQAQALSLCPPA